MEQIEKQYNRISYWMIRNGAFNIEYTDDGGMVGDFPSQLAAQRSMNDLNIEMHDLEIVKVGFKLAVKVSTNENILERGDRTTRPVLGTVCETNDNNGGQ